MAGHWHDKIGKTVHADGPLGEGYTLCGVSRDGVNGDDPMETTFGGIDCPHCIAVLRFCWKTKQAEVKPTFQRRRVGA